MHIVSTQFWPILRLRVPCLRVIDLRPALHFG